MKRFSQLAMVLLPAFIMSAPCLAQDDHCYQRTYSIRTVDKFFITTNDKRSEIEHNVAGAGKVRNVQFKYTVDRPTGAKSLRINLGYLFKGPVGPRRASLAIADAKAGALEDARRAALAAQQPAADIAVTEAFEPGSGETWTNIDITAFLPKLIPALEAGKDALVVVFDGDRPVAQFFLNGMVYSSELKVMAAHMNFVFPYAASGKCAAPEPSKSSPPAASPPSGGGGGGGGGAGGGMGIL